MILSFLPWLGLSFASLLKFRSEKLKKYRAISRKFGRRGPSAAMWAITTRCNCKCKFCKVWKKPTVEPSLEKALQIVDSLDSIGCFILSITGGEPLLYPHIEELIDHACRRGFVVQVNTNGSLLSELVSSISRADLVTVSLDYPDQRHDEVRVHPNLFRKVLRGVTLCRQKGLRVDFSTLLLGDQDQKDILKLARIAQAFDGSLVLSYPEAGGSLHAENWELPPRLELAEALGIAVDLKKRGYPIFNTALGLSGAVECMRNRTRLFPCFAAKAIIYLDWTGSVYPCLFEDKICDFDDLQNDYTFPDYYSCTRCYDQAWLDVSAIVWSTKEARFGSILGDLLRISRIAVMTV